MHHRLEADGLVAIYGHLTRLSPIISIKTVPVFFAEISGRISASNQALHNGVTCGEEVSNDVVSTSLLFTGPQHMHWHHALRVGQSYSFSSLANMKCMGRKIFTATATDSEKRLVYFFFAC